MKKPFFNPKERNPHRCRKIFSALAGVALMLPLLVVAAPTTASAATITAKVVAIDQLLVYNRMGVVNPQGMIYALARDVFPDNTPADQQTLANSCAVATCSFGNVKLRDDKRPRPIVLRMNEGDTLSITFTNLLKDHPVPGEIDPFTGRELDDAPRTRTAGITVYGLEVAAGSAGFDGANVGLNSANGKNGLVAPGGTITYRYFADKEGAYVLKSTAASGGGQGGNGSDAFGLFGMVNVEPRGATWYRSQVTRQEMDWATTGYTAAGHPIINYDAVYPPTEKYANKPILKILDGTEIFHSDLNAIIVQDPENPPIANPTYPNRNEPFREFSVAFHGEIKVLQAFPIFEDPTFEFTLGSVKDGFAINYGTGGIGAEILANRFELGPMAECVDCKYEEFFLTSWTVGDPAMIVDVPASANFDHVTGTQNPVTQQATMAFYPDDPSNVFHSYQNDRAKIRNLHLGSEHHIFHLHAHQWLFTPDDDNSNYLDSQAIGPGSAYTYEIAFGGSGNRNKTPGDAIFHCHFYPHFAQGMWGLWRVHDVFEIGTELADGLLPGEGLPKAGARALPDGEIAAGTPIPGVVPMPGLPMAPMPGADVSIVDGQAVITPMADYDNDNDMDDDDLRNPGYPFFIPAVAGHRPPTAPLDLQVDGGLPRHVITTAQVDNVTHTEVQTPLNFDKVLLSVDAQWLEEAGEPVERAAMNFHAQHFHDTYLPNGDYVEASFETNGMPPVPGAPFAEPCRNDTFGQTYWYAPEPTIGNPRTYRAAVIEMDAVLNKVGWHFPQQRILALNEDTQGRTLKDGKPPEPFVMRANTNDCVDYYHTNLVSNVYQQDDFQVKTPTDVIGQHIHLVKFDVLSADGAANGFNYEDGTLSPEEVIERIEAIRTFHGCDDPGYAGDPRDCPHATPGLNDVAGARTTIQRWYIDPIINKQGMDRGLGNVFTHDHFGPSTHQQVGLYATLLVEPEGTTFRDPETGVALNPRDGGWPTSWRADVIDPDGEDYREFYLEFADFQLAYDENGDPVNPPVKDELGLPRLIAPAEVCPNGSNPPCPEAISANDVGTWVVNYRNEPVPLRVSTPTIPRQQAVGQAGDLSYAFSSWVDRADPAFNTQPTYYTPLTQDIAPRDPWTPMMRVYDGDKVRVRVQTGAQEESSTASIHGVKWLQEYASINTGWRNAQLLGISEQFQFLAPVKSSGVRAGHRGDHLYTTHGAVDGWWNGTWGLMRSYTSFRSDLKPLPDNPIGTRGLTINNRFDFNEMCPRTADFQYYDVTAVLAQDVLPFVDTGNGPVRTLVYNSREVFGGPLHDPTAIMYVMTDDIVRDGAGNPNGLQPGTPIEPLILRAAAGECIQVTLRSELPDEMPDLAGFNTMPPIIHPRGVDGFEPFQTNDLKPSNSVGLHPQLVAYDVTASDGTNVGLNRRTQIAKDGDRRPTIYRWYAGDVSYDKVTGNLVATPIEFGATNLIPSDKVKHSNKGAVGALIIEPEGSTWTTDAGTRAQATVTHNGQSFREFVVIHQDDVNLRFGNAVDFPDLVNEEGEIDPLDFAAGNAVPNFAENEDAGDTGQRGLNYKTEPLWFRLGFAPVLDEGLTGEQDYTNAVSNTAILGQAGAPANGDPETPIYRAAPGQQVRFRVLQPGGHYRNSVIGLHGHSWQREPYVDTTVDLAGNDNDGLGSTAIGENPYSFYRGSQEGHNPYNHFDLVLRHGAGGRDAQTGDYLYRDLTPLHFNNGNWALFRVE